MIQATTETKQIIHRSDSRGHANYGWLDTRHSFSFSNYFDSQRIHFGALRVWNDDVIQPGTGFDTHPHDNMEIITIPLNGSVLHRDTMGYEEVVTPNEVQVMSAGSGIFHAEFNASKNKALSLFQIWILPKAKNIEPEYNQKIFDISQAENKWQLLVGPKEDSSAGILKINQDAYISRTFLKKGTELEYLLKPESYGTYLMTVEGKVRINNIELLKRDAIGLKDIERLEVEAIEDSYLINIEVPELNK